MSEPIPERLDSLRELNKRALLNLWTQHLRCPPPSQLPKMHLLRFLVYKLQEQAFGKLSPLLHKRLSELALNTSSNAEGTPSASPTVKPGTRLVREWKGQVHVVQAAEGSYEYRGNRYASLSEVARLITGTRWSGPLFFGLKNKRAGNARESR